MGNSLKVQLGQKNLYEVIKEYIKKQIADGELEPGDQIPTEKWYVDTFSVSRVTVRKAISELIDDHVLERRHSKSPRVPFSKMDRDLNKMSGLSEQILREGNTPSSKIIHFEKVKVIETIAAELNVLPGEEVLYINRVRYSNGIPIAIQKIYLPDERSMSITKEEISQKSLYTVLENKGIELDYCDQKIYAILPNDKQSELLEINKTTPLFYSRRRTYDKNGKVVEFVIAYSNSERYNITNRLYR